jgi:hypothetical protein
MNAGAEYNRSALVLFSLVLLSGTAIRQGVPDDHGQITGIKLLQYIALLRYVCAAGRTSSYSVSTKWSDFRSMPDCGFAETLIARIFS